tara:strand:- start:53 stop:766 length:714 start_codon:yes stop_codon:yes gene_type:complete
MSLGLGNSIISGNQYPVDWSPTELGSKLLHWYRFNTNITVATVESDDNAVTQWSDSAAAENHVAPTSTSEKAKMPQLQSDGSIKFQSTLDDLVFSSPVTLGTFAIYFRIKWDASETISSEDLMDDAGSSHFLKLASPTEARVKIGTRHDFTINEIVEGQKFVVGFERASNGDIKVYKDNVVGSAADGDSLNVATSTTIGLRRMGIPANTSNWYEVVMCNDSLTISERNQLYAYLNNI